MLELDVWITDTTEVIDMHEPIERLAPTLAGVERLTLLLSAAHGMQDVE